jgi:hypothetical protein
MMCIRESGMTISRIRIGQQSKACFERNGEHWCCHLFDSWRKQIVIVPSGARMRQLVRSKWLRFEMTHELGSGANELDELVERGQLLSAKIAQKLPIIIPLRTSRVSWASTRAKTMVRKPAARHQECVWGDNSIWKNQVEPIADWRIGGSPKLAFRPATNIGIEHGISQERLTADGRVDSGHIYELERNDGNATLGSLNKVAECLKAPLIEFFREPEPGAKKPKSMLGGRPHVGTR